MIIEIQKTQPYADSDLSVKTEQDSIVRKLKYYTMTTFISQKGLAERIGPPKDIQECHDYSACEPKHKICFRASEVSAVCGRHRYKPKLKQIDYVYDRIFPKDEKSNRFIDQNKLNIESISESKFLSLQNTSAELKNFVTIDKINDGAKEKLQNAISSTIENEPKNIQSELKNKIMQLSQMKRGTKLEMKALETLAHNGFDVRKYSGWVTKNFSKFSINGQVDGFLYENNILVGIIEVKTRMDQFFYPEYDIDQLAIYMLICDLHKGMLVQQFDGQIEVRVFSMEEMLPRLTIMVEKLNKVQSEMMLRHNEHNM